MNFLTQMLSSTDGDPSTMRIITLIGSLLIIGTWAFSSIKTGVLQPMDTGVLAALGVLIGGKVLQKGQEVKKELGACDVQKPQ